MNITNSVEQTGMENIPIQNNEVWTYTRVACEPQNGDNGLQQQKDMLIDYARKNDLIITKTFGNFVGACNGDKNREEITRLLNDLCNAKARPCAILVSDLNCITRDYIAFSEFIKTLTLEFDVKVIDVTNGNT